MQLFPVYPLLRASILDFRPDLGNRCKDFPVYPLFRASILDFKARPANRCMVLPVYALLRASILDFRPRLANRCNTIVVAVENGPPAMAVAATRSASDSILRCCKEERPACYDRCGSDLLRPILFFVVAMTFRIRFYSSLPQRRMARLQRPSPQRGPRPILFFVAAKENSFACSSRSGGDLPHPNN